MRNKNIVLFFLYFYVPLSARYHITPKVILKQHLFWSQNLNVALNILFEILQDIFNRLYSVESKQMKVSSWPAAVRSVR